MNCGIYQIRNLTNNKVYIGSSRNIKSRKSAHFGLLKKSKHPNKILQNSWNKYTKESFVFEPLEFCSVELLLVREQYYLDTLKPSLNIRPKAESNLGHKFVRTESQKESYKLAHKLAISAETREIMRGYKHTLGKKHTLETRQKMSQVAKKAIIQLDLAGNIIKEWSCAKEAATTLGFCRTALSSCANGNRRQAYKFIWKFRE